MVKLKLRSDWPQNPSLPTGMNSPKTGWSSLDEEGQLLPIAKYEVDHTSDDSVTLSLHYLGLRDGISETAELRYSSLRGMVFTRGAHTTVLSRD